MSDYRVFNRASVAGFDGTTVETAIYAQVGFVWDTGTTTEVGRFTPANLGRNNICSLVRVSLAGTLGGTDVVEVLSSGGQVRKSVLASLDSSGWLFLLPGDIVGVNAPAATGVSIVVNDLSEADLQSWITREGCCEDVPNLPLPQRELVVTASQNIPAYDGHLVVLMDCAADADLALPALIDTTAGLCSITFIRIGDPGQPRILPEDVTDEVNGRTGFTATQYFVRSIGDAVTYKRVDAGWTLQFGNQARQLTTAATNPILIPSVRGGTIYLRDTAALLDNEARLPLLSECEEGARVVYLNTDSLPHVVIPTIPDLLNNSSVASRRVQAEQVAVFEASQTAGWFGYGGGNQGITVSSGAVAISLSVAEVSGGVTVVEMTGAAGQDLLLPAVADVAPGSMIAVLNNSANAHDFVPDGLDEINGANATLPDVAADRTLIIAGGGGIGWLTITSA